MSKKPPEGGDNPWADVLEQVKDALIDAHITDSDTHDALAEGLQSALESLGDLGWSADVDAGSGPDVTVVEGGRRHDDPVESGQRPDLRVAEAPEDDPPADDAASRRVVTSVRVVRKGEAVGTLTGEGWILSDGPEDWQTVFRGDGPWPYRVACTGGALRVAIDGVPADGIRSGQSLDVDARLIRVASVEGAATGAYIRLAGSDSGD